MGIISLFQKLCSDAQVKVFGKCCQLKPGGDSSSSLDSSVTSSSDVKDQCPKYQVRSLISFIYSFTHFQILLSTFNVLCTILGIRGIPGTSPYSSGETDN